MTNKVLFLDCDGVLNSWKDFQHGEHNPLNPGSCQLLREVLDATNAKVVISSVWRMDFSWRKLLGDSGPLARSDLFDHDFITPVSKSGRRGEEIKIWLDRNPEVKQYAIVDDNNDFLAYQLPFFVQTPTSTGMQQTHADRLIELLR